MSVISTWSVEAVLDFPIDHNDSVRDDRLVEMNRRRVKKEQQLQEEKRRNAIKVTPKDNQQIMAAATTANPVGPLPIQQEKNNSVDEKVRYARRLAAIKRIVDSDTESETESKATDRQTATNKNFADHGDEQDREETTQNKKKPATKRLREETTQNKKKPATKRLRKEKLLQQRLQKYKEFKANTGDSGQGGDFFFTTTHTLRRGSAVTMKERRNLQYFKRLTEGKIKLKGKKTTEESHC